MKKAACVAAVILAIASSPGRRPDDNRSIQCVHSDRFANLYQGPGPWFEDIEKSPKGG